MSSAISKMALDDFTGMLASGQAPEDFETVLGMVSLAASDPDAVSKVTGARLPDAPSAEGFLLHEYLDSWSLAAARQALDRTRSEIETSDRATEDTAFTYAGFTADDIAVARSNAEAGDRSALVKVAQKFYFG